LEARHVASKCDKKNSFTSTSGAAGLKELNKETMAEF
jgi:hypothetical protein